ncbi:MAG: hypothetical protein C0518_13450 [Opitutus sp.]|nr:hypothetical protein [Opitutus sp.]
MISSGSRRGGERDRPDGWCFKLKQVLHTVTAGRMNRGLNWLLLLYALPARQGSSRVSLWRQLKRSGAIALKTSTYLLPDEPVHQERFQWLAQQVRESGGDATLIHATDIEGITDEEIVRMFNRARAADYEAFVADLGAVIAANRRKPGESFATDLERFAARLEEIRQIDYFDAPPAEEARMQLERARHLHAKRVRAPATLSAKRYRGRTWLTRPRPEIDRVGSAWLIRRFIDPEARFVFSSDPSRHPEALPFDLADVEFSHHGDDCTFETLVKRFAVDDRAVRQIAEMVHAADIDDGKFARAEAIGLDRMLKGWARMGLPDEALLEKGGECFDALHEFLRKKR